MAIVIEKGVPIPQANSARKPYGEISRKMSEMQVGDSFALPVTKETNISTLQSKVRQSAKRVGIKITARHIVENEKEVLRVWRIADESKEGDK